MDSEQSQEQSLKDCVTGMRNYADYLAKQRATLGAKIPLIFAARWILRIDGLKNPKRLFHYVRLGVLLLYIRFLAFRVALKLNHVEDNIYESEAIMNDRPVRHDSKKLGFVRDK